MVSLAVPLVIKGLEDVTSNLKRNVAPMGPLFQTVKHAHRVAMCVEFKLKTSSVKSQTQTFIFEN